MHVTFSLVFFVHVESLSICLFISLSLSLSASLSKLMQTWRTRISVSNLIAMTFVTPIGETHLNDMMVLLVHNYPTVDKHQQTAQP